MIRVQKINVFGDAGVDVVNQSVNQFIEFMAGQENIVEAALMPDCHLGYSVPIGSVFSSDGVIYPSAVGYDIGCGMCAIKTTFDPEVVRKNAKEIFEEIYSRVPVGFNHSSRDANWDERYGLSASSVTKAIFEKNGLRQLGTLGGGNHFIEVGQDQEGSVWIVVHSGSRNVGHSVATHYMRLASGTGKAKEGPFGFDVNSANGKDYAMDLNFCLRFALENRQQIIENVFEAIRRYTQGFLLWNTFINRNHNHAEEKDGLWIHRKGATHAEEGMFGVIPGNMRDGSFIVLGKGNPNSLCSSSHGAGRVLGRRQANEKLSLDDFMRTMRDAKVTARTDRNTLDESPLAYKDIFEVMELQKDLVDVVAHVRPIINVKG